MFDDSLLESSSRRAPILNGIHWLISIVVGLVIIPLLNYVVLPAFSAADPGVILFVAITGGIYFGFFALILCYVWADAGRNGFNRGLWMGIVFVLGLLVTWLISFTIYLIYSAKKTGDWKRATIPIAYMFECIIVGVLVLIPLIYTEALPKAQLMTFLAAPPPPPPPPPPPAAAPPVRVIRHISVEDVMRAPTVIPKTIAQVKDEPEPPPNSVGVVGGVVGGVPGGSFGGVLGGVIGGALSSATPPPLRLPSPRLPSASGWAGRWNRLA